MIRQIKGNIFESTAEALVNTVNTVGVMGKGLALQFKEIFPENYRLYREACKKGEVQIGKMFVTSEKLNGADKTIINFPTKGDWRKPSEYQYITSGLVALRHEITSRHIRSVAIPPLGAHNGGLDWECVKDLIIKMLGDLDCELIIYEPNAEIVEKLKAERVKLTPARAMLLDMMCDMSTEDECASVFAAEKLVYFMQRMGASDIFKIHFSPYIYGPYSGGKINHMLYHLNGSYIKGMTGMQNRPFDPIWLLPDAQAVVADYMCSETNKAYTDICERTKPLLRGYYASSTLEMLSTIDYLLNNNPVFADWQSKSNRDLLPDIQNSLKEWSRRKEKLFNEERNIFIVLDHLRQYLN